MTRPVFGDPAAIRLAKAGEEQAIWEERHEKCQDCDAHGNVKTRCEGCDGSGEITMTCEDCGGEGSAEERCEHPSVDNNGEGKG